MSVIIKTLLLALPLLFVSSLASATDYYISPTGSNAGLGTTIDSPWKTFQKAADSVRGGDTVYARGGRGNYKAFTIKNVNGSPTAWITFKSYPGEQAVIDSNLGGGESPVDGDRGLHFNFCSYIIIDNIDFTNNNPEIDALKSKDVDDSSNHEFFLRMTHSPAIKILNSKNITIQNSELYHNGGHGILSGAPSGSNDNHAFINNVIHGNAGGRGSPVSAYGVYVVGDNIIVRGNTLYNNSGHGIRLGSDNNWPLTNSIIENNISHNNGGKIYHISSGESRDAGDGIIIWYGQNNTIRNNLIYDVENWGLRSKNYKVSNNLWINNTVYNTGYNGMRVHLNNTDRIVNNIFYQVGTYSDKYTSNSDPIWFQVDPTYPVNRATESNNLIEVDPKFVSAAANDYRLLQSSPARDTGTSISAPTNDITGTARPQGREFDIGAYEHVPKASLVDDFSIDSTPNYLVTHTKTDGGIGKLLHDVASKRAQVLTGDNVALQFSHDIITTDSGVLKLDFYPTAKYPLWGEIRIRIKQDKNNYYEIYNTDGNGPGSVREISNGQITRTVDFTSEFTKDNSYPVVVTFSPTKWTVKAFGSQFAVNSTKTISVNQFEIELSQQDAFFDNIEFGPVSTLPPNMPTKLRISKRS